MATQYNGKSANITSTVPAAISIASSTNTSPIVYTTATAHEFNVGDTVDVSGHQVNTTGNLVGVVDPASFTTNTFAITGSTGNGVGGATGTAQELGLGSYSIPADGDADAVASVNVAFETLGDQVAFLATATGKYKAVQAASIVLASTDNGTPWGGNPALTTATWTQLNVPMIVIPGTIPGDLIDVEFTGAGWFSGTITGVTVARVGLMASQIEPGGTDTWVKCGGSAIYVPISTSVYTSVSLSTRIIATANQVSVRVGFWATFSGSPTAWQWVDDASAKAVVWRATSMPQ
jgi:hypothetical protein